MVVIGDQCNGMREGANQPVDLSTETPRHDRKAAWLIKQESA